MAKETSSISLQRLDDLDAADIVALAEERGKQFRQIKTHQIRSFYSEINAMKLRFSDRNREPENKQDIVDILVNRMHLLKPRLAYRAGGRGPREGGIREFYTFISEVITGVQAANSKETALENFFILIESIVAYHKYHGGD